MAENEIPQDVIEALAEVRERGETNMFGRTTVIDLCDEYGWQEAAEWLEDNKDRYMDALNAMGKWVTAEREQREAKRQLEASYTEETMMAALNAGKTIEAVKQYRVLHGAGLQEAIEAVKQIRKEPVAPDARVPSRFADVTPTDNVHRALSALESAPHSSADIAAQPGYTLETINEAYGYLADATDDPPAASDAPAEVTGDYRCPMCARRFVIKAGLKLHLQQDHGMTTHSAPVTRTIDLKAEVERLTRERDEARAALADVAPFPYTSFSVLADVLMTVNVSGMLQSQAAALGFAARFLRQMDAARIASGEGETE